MSTTFGFIIPQRGAMFGLGSTRELLDLAVRAEQCEAIDTVWVGDSLTSKHRPESLTCLGALAGMTQRLRLAVGCMGSFPLRDPAVFALQWATLDHISNGRMLLSVCNGIQRHGGSVTEGENWGGIRDRDRSAALEENLEICRRLWTGEVLNYTGRFHTYTNLYVLPAPLQDPLPVWITANPAPRSKFLERVLHRVAAQADGWMTTFPGASVFADMKAVLAEGLQKVGKDLDTYPIAVYHNVNIGPSRPERLLETKGFADHYYGPGVLDAMIDDMTVAGTVSECVDQILELSRQGISHVGLRITSFEQTRQLDILVNEVLPEAAAQISKLVVAS